MSKKTFCLSLIWTCRSFITSVSFSLQLFLHLFSTKEENNHIIVNVYSRSLVTSETLLILVKTLLEVFQAFSLFANGTAAYRLQVRQLLQLLSVDFVRFLKYNTDWKSTWNQNGFLTHAWPFNGQMIATGRSKAFRTLEGHFKHGTIFSISNSQYQMTAECWLIP